MTRRREGFDRRQFLTGVSAGMLLAAMHPTELLAGLSGNSSSRPRYRKTPLLRELRLRTSAPLEQMTAFYAESLGLAVEESNARSLTVRAGATRINFVPASQEEGRPFYHFAFNIPENKLRAARDWQAERTPLIEIPENLRDSRFPDDVVHFRNWNAHSVFFFDPAGNVLEHIARHDLGNAAQGPFTSRDLHCASEIAFISDDVLAMASEIRETFGMQAYRPPSEAFAATGDEQGLLLVFRRGRNIGFDAKPPRLADVHPVDVVIDGPAAKRYRAESYPFSIRRGS